MNVNSSKNEPINVNTSKVTLGIAAAGATGKSIGATAASQNPVKNYST
jgi:hypothetical protein